MSNKVVVSATKRTVTGKKVKLLRNEGILPAVVYGNVDGSLVISLNAKEAGNALHNLAASVLVNVELEGKEYPSLVREKQYDFLTDAILHVDFQAVSLTETIRSMVPIVLIGEAPAVKNFNAFIISDMTELEVEALPQELPERIRVDVSGIERIGDSRVVADLDMPDNITVLSDPTRTVVVATGGRTEEELDALDEIDETIDISGEPEVIEKGSIEEEEEEEE